MSDKTTLGTRMKENYENRTKQFLTRRCPTIIRIDGKAFHTYTKGLKKPFDEGLIEDMQETTKFLCEQIQGAKLGYTQSDEISILLTDYDNLQSQAWFDYNVQKITSITASLATAKFNELRLNRLHKKLAFFDARVFQVPEKEEVVNYFIWRQQDAERNSISMLAQSLYSHKQLFKKNTSNMQEMCFQKGYNWNDLPYEQKRGSFIVKNLYINDKLMHIYEKESQWCSDKDREPTLGDLWYQKDLESHNYPNKKGRLLKWTQVNNRFVDEDGKFIDSEDWCEAPLEKIRTKWESIKTPIFSQNREMILKYI